MRTTPRPRTTTDLLDTVADPDFWEWLAGHARRTDTYLTPDTARSDLLRRLAAVSDEVRAALQDTSPRRPAIPEPVDTPAQIAVRRAELLAATKPGAAA